MELEKLIDQEQQERTSPIKKELKKLEKEFEFIRMITKEHYNEIKDYLEWKSGFANLSDIYDVALQISYVFKELGESEKTTKHFCLTICDYIPEANPKNYLPVKMGFFSVKGTSNDWQITKKGKEIKENYFQ